jgi:hypothetical protein
MCTYLLQPVQNIRFWIQLAVILLGYPVFILLISAKITVQLWHPIGAARNSQTLDFSSN